MIAAELGRLPPPRLPDAWVRAAAGCGDLLRLLGWPDPPLTSRRLANMRTSSPPFPLAPTLEVAGPSPYTVGDGIRATIAALRAEKLI